VRTEINLSPKQSNFLESKSVKNRRCGSKEDQKMNEKYDERFKPKIPK
jgi:hypothetical protein